MRAIPNCLCGAQLGVVPNCVWYPAECGAHCMWFSTVCGAQMFDGAYAAMYAATVHASSVVMSVVTGDECGVPGTTTPTPPLLQLILGACAQSTQSRLTLITQNK